jgi:hypothetical protein
MLRVQPLVKDSLRILPTKSQHPPNYPAAQICAGIDAAALVITIISRFELPLTVTDHAAIDRIGGLPVSPDGILGHTEMYIAATNQTLQLDLQTILAFGTFIAFPDLQHQVVWIARMSTQSQGNDVVQLEATFASVKVHSLVTHQALLDAIGKGGARPHGLGVARCANGFSNRGRHHVGIEQVVGDCMGR